MKLLWAATTLKEQLAAIYEAEEAAAITQMVMQELSGQTKSQQRMQENQELSAEQIENWEKMKTQLLQHRPVQYVLGKAWFYNMVLQVDDSVLIPRPETEELVHWILEEEKTGLPLRTLDIGTGSGCIPIALKKNRPSLQMFACDISDAALNLARKNAAAQQTAIEFSKVDILQEADWPQQQFDIIVSNPPYIPQQEHDQLDKNVTDWEPHLALFVPSHNALLFYTTIAAFAQKNLAPNGVLYFEGHQDYIHDVVKALQATGFVAQAKNDLFGNARMVKATLQ